MILDLRRNNGFVFESYSRAHEKEKPAFSNSSGLKSVFKKLRFRDRLVWTVGLTVELKLRFHISLASCGRDLRVKVSFVPYSMSYMPLLLPV